MIVYSVTETVDIASRL